jgi:predicted PurR-regulated permease PerM
MSEILSRVFITGVLLFYAGLVMAFLLWSLRRWLRGSGKKRTWPAILEYVTRSRRFNRPSNAR